MNETDIHYAWDISRFYLYIYHGRHMTMVALTGMPMAVKLAQIHHVRRFSIRYGKEEHREDAYQRAKIASRFLKYDVPVIDATWPDLSEAQG